MASGSSGGAISSSKGFDFASDDILCSYEDYSNQELFNGTHNEPVISSNSEKDFNRSRMTRTSAFPATAYNQPDDSLNQDVVSFVEESMKKHTANLMRFLEGITSRLSQLELYCYNLNKSIGEMRSDLLRDHGDADSKLKSLDKHLQEVHRSVQILRDKQELAETQKELAKLQLVHKESSSSTHSQSNEDRASPIPSNPKTNENPSEPHNQQLALALPHHLPSQQSRGTPSLLPPPQNITQQQSYYMPSTQVPNPPAPNQHPQSQYLPPAVSQAPQIQAFTQYQPQWPQQVPQQVQPSPMQQPQVRPPPMSVYSSYAPNQQSNPSIQEPLPSSMPMQQVQFSSIPQPGSSRVDSMPYGYSGAGQTIQHQPPPQQMNPRYGTQPVDGYQSSVPHSALPPGSGYMICEGEGGRTHQPPPQQAHFSQGGYPPTNLSLHNPPQSVGPPPVLVRNPSQLQFVRGHRHGELIEKLVSMGFRSDHVASVIQRMEESGRSVDFNTVLDRLNVWPSSLGASQRAW